jgi:hypothetical protein
VGDACPTHDDCNRPSHRYSEDAVASSLDPLITGCPGHNPCDSEVVEIDSVVGERPFIRMSLDCAVAACALAEADQSLLKTLRDRHHTLH